MSDPVGPLPPSPTPFPPPNTGPITEEEKSKKLLAGILGIVVGGLGIHKFVLGYQKEGIIHLCACLGAIVLTTITCGIAFPVAFIPGIIGLVEGIIYLTKTDEEFVRIYVRGRRPWF